MNFDPTTIVSNFRVETITYVKIALLILLGLYSVFTFMLATKIRSLNRTIFLPLESGEGILRLFALIYFFAVLSLFLLTLVIV